MISIGKTANRAVFFYGQFFKKYGVIEVIFMFDSVHFTSDKCL